jgi:hypothetical protein
MQWCMDELTNEFMATTFWVYANVNMKWFHAPWAIHVCTFWGIHVTYTILNV